MRTVFFLLIFAMTNIANAQNPLTVFFTGGNICESTPFKLVFFDEFNGTELNTAKWTQYYPYGPNGTDQCPFCRTHSTLEKQEGQIYRDENVRVSDGILYLDVKQEAGTWFDFNKKYTSGMIQSIQSFNTYTKYEVRCKISAGVGYWPAFWTFGGNTEIDVFEFYEEADRFECSVHYWDNYYPHFLGIDWPDWLEDLNIEQFNQIVEPGIDMSQDFHTYAVEYDKFFVNFYLDGVKKVTMPRYFTLDGNPVINCNVPAGIYIQHPEFPKYGNPLNVIANVALFDEPADQLNIVPKSMEIDYIRVYQRNPQSGLSDLCNSFKINGVSSLCFDKTKQDTMIYCFDGVMDESSTFITTNNLEITQNPAYDLIRFDTTIVINGILKDTFYFDTLFQYGCIRITPKPNVQNGFGSISITTNVEPCGVKTFSLPIQLGIPFPQIYEGRLNPCRKEISLKTIDYNKDTQIEWSIYDQGTLSFSPNISYSYGNEIYIELPNQRIFSNSYFFIKLKVTTWCGTKEVIQKIQLPDIDCKNIEFRISPNPSDGFFSIELLEVDMLNEISKIYVRNSNTNDLTFVKGNVMSLSDLDIDLNHLPNGSYIISIENTENQLFSKTLQLFK